MKFRLDSVLMLLSSLLFIIGGVRAQLPRRYRAQRGYGAILFGVVAIGVGFATAYTRQCAARQTSCR